jgi:hypothetical protein
MKVPFNLFSSAFHIPQTEPPNPLKSMMITDAESFSKREWDKKLKQIPSEINSRVMSLESMEASIRMALP